MRCSWLAIRRVAKRTLSVMACAFAAGACADPTSEGSAKVQADFAAQHLIASNQGARPVFYFAVDRIAAATILWAPCVDPDSCPRIDPRHVETIPLENIAFWETASTEALFYWWHLVPTHGGAFQPDSIRSIVVRR